MTSTLKMEKILCLVAVLFVTGSLGVDTTVAPTEAPTTMKPTTTTATTTMVPVKPPKSDNNTEATVKTYTFYDNTTKKVCILSEMAVKFIFSYVKKDADNKTVKVGIEWNLPNNTMVSNKLSKCGNHTQKLVLSFFEEWELTLTFNKSQKGDKFEVNSTSLMFVASNYRFQNITLNTTEMTATTTTSQVMFNWKDDTALKCKSNVDLHGFSATAVNVSLVELQTSAVIMEAFRTTNTTSPSKGPYTYCPADTSVSNIVPISVGAALAGLVLIVLIAYLIGRSRNQRGYESV